jgi:hypothetical protein
MITYKMHPIRDGERGKRQRPAEEKAYNMISKATVTEGATREYTV